MIKTIFILGRQPNIGLAELESYFNTATIDSFFEEVALLDHIVAPAELNNLGGTIKLVDYLSQIESNHWPVIEKYILTSIVPKILELPEGKINFGISCYGLDLLPKQLLAFSLSIKKIIKSQGRSFRIVPNQTAALSSAQVIHNKLAGANGYELVVCVKNHLTLLGRTTAVQDIANYASRDQARPYRDAKVGMLPPKLAQIMINLANPVTNATILDPFCGTGVILQEALLRGYEAVGSDVDPRMVSYSKENLNWLTTRFGSIPKWQVLEADATKFKWPVHFDIVVSETYLGNPLFKLPEISLLKRDASYINNLIEEFLINLAKQIQSNTRICIAVPAWYLGNDYLHLSVLDHLEKIGYNHMSFKSVDTNALIYHRPQQLVARQLLVLIRK